MAMGPDFNHCMKLIHWEKPVSSTLKLVTLVVTSAAFLPRWSHNCHLYFDPAPGMEIDRRHTILNETIEGKKRKGNENFFKS